jgi:hypothetical protein
MNRAKLYAKALVSLKGNPNQAAITDKVIAEIHETGRAKLLPSILREIKVLEMRKAYLEPRLEVAHQKDGEAAMASAKEAGIHAARAHVNHTLLSGWRARAGGKLVDRSGKSALITIYKKVTS